jgi:hypothetical protein
MFVQTQVSNKAVETHHINLRYRNIELLINKTVVFED